MNESCMNAQEVADLLRITKRAFMERRHFFEPRFPAPIFRRPLVYRTSDVQQWLADAGKRAQQERRR